MADKAKILVICGPTATGKTSLSVSVAKHLNGEIICADSMQIYKELSIGTAKVTPEEQGGVAHYLVDFLPPSQRFSVAEYTLLAKQHIEEITKRGKLPIIVGGTGQYIESLVKGMHFAAETTDERVREKIQKRLENEGAQKLYSELCEIDLPYAKKLHINNTVKITRALELYEQTGKTMTWQLQNSLPKERPFSDKIFCLNYSSRAELYDKINARVDSMVQSGLLQEAKLVHDNKSTYTTAAQAIGYKEFFKYFEGKSTLEDCVNLLKQATRNYAKRQLTWFKRMENVTWLEAGSGENLQNIEKLINL